MLGVKQGKVGRESSKAIGSESVHGAMPQASDAIERNTFEVKPSRITYFEDRGAPGIVMTPTLTASLSQVASLDLAGSSLPKLKTALASSPKEEGSLSTLPDESATLRPAAERRSGFLRELSAKAKTKYDFYFSAGGVVRDVVDVLIHGAGWMSGVSVTGASLALFGLAPVPFFGGVAAGLGAYQAVRFMGRGLTGAIWGTDGLS